MKPLILTALAQETSLAPPNDTLTFLVFNDGVLRVPIDSDYIQGILNYLESASDKQSHPQEVLKGVEVFGGSDYEEPEQDDDDEYAVNDGVGSV